MRKTMIKRFQAIFNTTLTSADPFEHAIASSQKFCRSQDQLAAIDADEEFKVKGRVLSAFEALDAYGIDVVEEAFFNGVAILVENPKEPAATIKDRRESLGLTQDILARVSDIPLSSIEQAEDSSKRIPIRELQKICEVLGLDERLITFTPGANGDNELSARLKTINSSQLLFTPKQIASFSECAWIIATETRLRNWLKSSQTSNLKKFKYNSNYNYPVWERGYRLALEARQLLGLNEKEPILSLRNLCTDTIEIPLIQQELVSSIAGATIANGPSRGIIVNIIGHNSNVWIRRMTIAHELGHLLLDSNEKLNSLKIDAYDEIDNLYLNDSGIDFVEQRANAFAIAFLAPPLGVTETCCYSDGPDDQIRNVMKTFGISFTAAVHHIANITKDKSIRNYLKSSSIDRTDTDEWKARESYTIDYFPIKNTNDNRRGSFAGQVVKAEIRGFITISTAAMYLQTNIEEYRNHKTEILDLL